jgi:soluble lytic murein transglycosylase-like protein
VLGMIGRVFHIIGIVVLVAPVWAGEYVVLGNGFRLHADRHEVNGAIVRVFSGAGVTEMSANAIAGYEQEEIIAPVRPENAAAKPATPAVAEPVPAATTPAEFATQAAKKFQLPGSFVRSVMKAESGFQPNAVSPKGAIGLMQLLPGTAHELGVDPRNPQENANGGAQYLRDLLARYESDPNQVLLALAAYNAGPAAVERYHGVPPFRETREYILRVLKNWDSAGNK